MCLYVCAPGVHIRLEYVSETIELLKDGSSKVLVDLLITNKSPTPIPSLLIIYPNSFVEVHKDLQAVDGFGEFKDVTNTFLKSDCEENWQYNIPGASLTEKSPPPGYLWQPPQGAIPKCIRLSDPINPLTEMEYYGVIQGSSQLVFYDFRPEHWLVLESAKYTALQCKFEIPLTPEIPRLVRWDFHAKTAALNPTRGFKRIIRKSINNLYFIYQICGPYNVKKGLHTYLKSNLTKDAHRVTGKVAPDMEPIVKEATTSVIHALYEKGTDLPGTWTSANDWRIHINPSGVGGRLTDVECEGDVFISGAMPNMVQSGDTCVPYYEWKTGHRMMPNPVLPGQQVADHEYWFQINFQAKRQNYLVLFLPWLAIILGLFNFILNLLKGLFW